MWAEAAPSAPTVTLYYHREELQVWSSCTLAPGRSAPLFTGWFLEVFGVGQWQQLREHNNTTTELLKVKPVTLV